MPEAIRMRFSDASRACQKMMVWFTGKGHPLHSQRAPERLGKNARKNAPRLSDARTKVYFFGRAVQSEAWNVWVTTGLLVLYSVN